MRAVVPLPHCVITWGRRRQIAYPLAESECHSPSEKHDLEEGREYSSTIRNSLYSSALRDVPWHPSSLLPNSHLLISITLIDVAVVATWAIRIGRHRVRAEQSRNRGGWGRDTRCSTVKPGELILAHSLSLSKWWNHER